MSFRFIDLQTYRNWRDRNVRRDGMHHHFLGQQNIYRIQYIENFFAMCIHILPHLPGFYNGCIPFCGQKIGVK